MMKILHVGRDRELGIGLDGETSLKLSTEPTGQTGEGRTQAEGLETPIGDPFQVARAGWKTTKKETKRRLINKSYQFKLKD